MTLLKHVLFRGLKEANINNIDYLFRAQPDVFNIFLIKSFKRAAMIMTLC